MRIIESTTAERIIALGHELQHQVVRFHADCKEEGIIAVVQGEKILGAQLHPDRNLDGFVTTGGRVHILGHLLEVPFVCFAHALSGCHQAERFLKHFL